MAREVRGGHPDPDTPRPPLLAPLSMYFHEAWVLAQGVGHKGPSMRLREGMVRGDVATLGPEVPIRLCTAYCINWLLAHNGKPSNTRTECQYKP